MDLFSRTFNSVLSLLFSFQKYGWHLQVIYFTCFSGNGIQPRFVKIIIFSEGLCSYCENKNLLSEFGGTGIAVFMIRDYDYGFSTF